MSTELLRTLRRRRLQASARMIDLRTLMASMLLFMMWRPSISFNVRFRGTKVYMTPLYRTDASSSSSSYSSSNFTQRPSAAQLITHHTNGSTIIARDVLSAEEREKNDMEWLVNTTQHVLFPPAAASNNKNGEPSSGPKSKKNKPLSRSQSRRIHNLMKAWGVRRTQGAPYVVDQLFDHLQEKEALTIHSYNLRMEAWALSKDANSIDKCMEILQAIKEHNDLNPNVHSYNACIKAWIRNATQTSLERAEKLLDEMQDVYDQTLDIMMAPNRRSFNLVLYGLAHSNHTKRAAHKAVDIFDSMMTSEQSFHQPNSNTLQQVILCLARNTEEKGYEDILEASFQRCLELAQEKEVEIYADTFNVYMSGWLKSNRSSSLQHIQDTLKTMEQMYEGGNKISAPNCATMNIVLAAQVRFSGANAIDLILDIRKRLQCMYSLTPDTITFNTLIDAHCKSRRAVADVAALSLLQIMERHLIKGKKLAKPDSFSYCAVIDCLAKTKMRTAGSQSEQLLRRMTELHRTSGGERPSLAVYNAVLNAMADSSPVNITSVKVLLAEMENPNEGSIAPKPNVVTYNTALKAALRSGSVQSAEYADEILRSLEAKASRGGVLKPDSFSYTTVIAAYGKSWYHDKAIIASELVERALRNFHEGRTEDSPRITIFNAACNACCFVDGDKAEKVRAFSTMAVISNLLTNYTKPDEITFGTLLRACSQLLDPSDTKQQIAVKQIFRKACEHGCCSEFVLNRFRLAASPDTYRELLGFELDDPLSKDDIPHSWRRNSKFD